MANYTTAFYEPLVSDWSNFETWSEKGEQSAFERANKIYRQRLEDYEPPEINESTRSTLEAYVAERRDELESQI
jgi:trimethylamine--corrinoid protein Co-methyltransferase